ncbi:hypothetical protein NW766_006166 [Fusarium irregulare]|uniref:Inhibitor I9 domain-containing protein n=1 Tax=Fusarium irregulare TaxID=2494466 RepID=A0A9W8PPF0_9HYPO|nr:hypothetical protein NW766_006166 [Fusarium irregulare]
MPSYIVKTTSNVTCKDDASDDQVKAYVLDYTRLEDIQILTVKRAKQHAIDQGGKIGHEYSLIKGFSVEFPHDSVQTLESHEHVKAVEADGEMKTQ